MIPTIVRVSNGITEQLLAQKVPVVAVTPRLLRGLLRGANASDALQKAALSNLKVLEALLDFIQPIEDQDFVELDGCCCLPLADGSIGTINLTGPSKFPEYYLANQNEITLFTFASAILINRKPGNAFKEALIESRKFNVARLSLSDIGYVLKRRFLDGNATENTDKWMSNFWAYWNRVEGPDHIMVKTVMSAPDIRRNPIFEASCDGVKSYMAASKLDALPAVIEPSDEKHRVLCGKFAGIYKFNQSFLPEYLKTTEATFSKGQSFRRFIKALVILARKESSSVEKYIRECIAPDDLEVRVTIVSESDNIPNTLCVRLFRS